MCVIAQPVNMCERLYDTINVARSQLFYALNYGEIFCRRNVLSVKCPVGKTSVGQKSVGLMSVGQRPRT